MSFVMMTLLGVDPAPYVMTLLGVDPAPYVMTLLEVDPALFWNPRNYWCSEGTRNHQRFLTMMSRISRDIKPLLQHNSRNNLIFVPWLRSVDTVYVDGSQESNTFFSSK